MTVPERAPRPEVSRLLLGRLSKWMIFKMRIYSQEVRLLFRNRIVVADTDDRFRRGLATTGHS